jgi:hypothetical protein
MRATLAPEDKLLADGLRGPSPADAARSLAYWRARLERLPRRRVAARREARAMIVTWEERVRRAEIERYGGGPLGRMLAAVAVVRGERPGAVVRRTARWLVPRRVLTGLATCVLVGAVTFGVVLGVIAARLL